MVQAKCILFAWDSVGCRSYEPGKGKLEGGLYEIDPESQLAELTTAKGDYIFQWEGHEKKAGFKPKLVVEPRPQEQDAPERPKRTMSDALKKKMAAGRAARKAAREASVAA
jgi:hypothetical protein